MGTRKRLVTCAFALVTALLCTSATASAAVYAGQTDQHAPIAITVGKNGQVKTIALDWGAQCQSGKGYTFAGVLTAAKKKPTVFNPGENPLIGKVKKGRFTAKAFGADNLGDQVGASITQTIKG